MQEKEESASPVLKKKKKKSASWRTLEMCAWEGRRENQCVCVHAPGNSTFACKGGRGTGRTRKRIRRMPTSVGSNKPLPESATLSQV